MSTRASLLAFILLCAIPARAEPPAPFPLIGLWRSVSATARDGHDITPRSGGLEIEFLRDNIMIQTVTFPERTDGKPIRVRYGYTFQPPDTLNYTYSRDGRVVTQQQRFRVERDFVTFENVDSGIVTKMRRIQHSELKSPKDLPELPK
jgi:hypothetical protein